MKQQAVLVLVFALAFSLIAAVVSTDAHLVVKALSTFGTLLTAGYTCTVWINRVSSVR